LLNQKVLEYVDDVMSKVTATDDFKLRLENKLFRHLAESSESGDIDEITRKLGSPKELADNITVEMMTELIKSGRSWPAEPAKPDNYRKHMPPRYAGEFMREDSNVNIKLLYIPLIQISSGTQRVTRPLMYDDDDDCN
jgi:lysyl-tRNA synthetase class II